MRNILALPGGTVTKVARPGSDAKNLEVFKAELIREGVYKHPTEGYTVRASREKLESWREEFSRMRQAGRMVTLPPGHDARFDPARNFGELTEVAVEKASDGTPALFGYLNVPRAEDASKIGTTIKRVSIGLVDGFKDGFGEWSGIDHVALTNDPVVTTSGNFQKVLDAETHEEYRVIGLEAVAGAGKHLAADDKGEFIFGAKHSKVTDEQDHFPIDTQGRARNALVRAAQLAKSSGRPRWFTGTPKQFLDEVRRVVKKRWPAIEVTGLASEVLHATLDGKNLGPVKDLMDREAGGRAMDYLMQCYYRLCHDEEMDAEEKMADFEECLADVKELVAPALAAQLEGPSADWPNGVARTLGINLEGNAVDLKALRAKLGLDDKVADDAVIAKAVDAVGSLTETKTHLEAQLEAARKATPPSPQPQTENEKRLEGQLLETRLESARDRRKADTQLLDAAQKAGKFSTPAAEALGKLLSVRTGQAMNMDTGAAETVNVRELAEKVILETRDHAAVSTEELCRTLKLEAIQPKGGAVANVSNLSVEDIRKLGADQLKGLTSADMAALPEDKRMAIGEVLAGVAKK